MEEVFLTIAVITMNRQKKLIEALESCISCKLHQSTEFVIFDNASTDDTKNAIEEFSSRHQEYEVRYFYSHENLGVGGGRNKAFEYSRGKYVYFLDDDAIISPENEGSFFVDNIDFLENNTSVASVTTQIYDEIFGYSRTQNVSTKTIDGMPLMFFYLGGSHFLRKSYFSNPLYFDIKYGSEEYVPSILAFDKGYYNVFNKNVSIIHKPERNKWVEGTDEMRKILVSGAAVTYATKKMLYPKVFMPIVYLGYKVRTKKHLAQYKGAKNEADKMIRKICTSNKIKKIKISTVIKLYNLFGITVF